MDPLIPLQDRQVKVYRWLGWCLDVEISYGQKRSKLRLLAFGGRAVIALRCLAILRAMHEGGAGCPQALHHCGGPNKPERCDLHHSTNRQPDSSSYFSSMKNPRTSSEIRVYIQALVFISWSKVSDILVDAKTPFDLWIVASKNNSQKQVSGFLTRLLDPGSGGLPFWLPETFQHRVRDAAVLQAFQLGAGTMPPSSIPTKCRHPPDD